MTTECKFCGSVKVIMDHTKNGHPYLRDYGQPHRFTCSVNKKERKKVPSVRKELESLGFTAEEAARIMAKHKGLSDDEMILAALKEKGA